MQRMRTKSRCVFGLFVAIAVLICADVSGQAKPATRAGSAPAAQICSGANGPHVMFLMFLNAPPRVASPDWVLQSMTSMDFETCFACAAAAQSIANSLARTPTINLAGWCFAKEPANASNFVRSQKIGPGTPVPLTPPLDLQPQP